MDAARGEVKELLLRHGAVAHRYPDGQLMLRYRDQYMNRYYYNRQVLPSRSGSAYGGIGWAASFEALVDVH